MNIEDIKQYLNDNKDNTEVVELINSLQNKPTLEGVTAFLSESQEGKDFLQKYGDNRVTKGIETWKSNNLQKLIEAEMLKKNPQLTPEQIELNNLKAEIENIKKEKKRAEMVAKFKDVLGEKKIPSKMVEFLLSDDEEVTNANISLFEESMQAYIAEGVKTRLGESGYVPPKGTNEPTVNNPWSKATLNLTEQAKILRENPTLAQQLKASAVK